MASRSSSQYNAPTLQAENQELLEQNRNLGLKLRYVQSVNTIFRQRVGTLMQTLTSKIVEMQLATNHAPVDLSAIYAQADETARAKMPNIDPDVDYWQAKFLDAMASVQPISQHEVETLCRLIREKVDRQHMVATGAGATPLPAGAAAGARSPSAASQSPGSATYAASVAGEVLALREKLEQTEARCKSLTHRLGECRKKHDAEERERSQQNVSLTEQVGSLTASARELRARLAEQEALNRRLTAEINVLRGDKNLQLQHLARMQGMCAAVMRESQCAVNEGLAATQMNETALLKRQMDTFELVLRKTELELSAARKACEDKDAALAERERELHALQLRMDSKDRTLELYRSRCEAMATAEKDQREEQARAMQSLSTRLSEAVGDLSGAFTTKGIAVGLDALNASTSKISDVVGGTLDEVTKQYNSLRASYVAIVEEVTLASKEHRAPRVNAISGEAARVLLGEVKFPRELVLRVNGTWSEVRDLNSGDVFYTTTDIAQSPFDPNHSTSAAAKPGAATPSSSSSSPPPSPKPAPKAAPAGDVTQSPSAKALSPPAQVSSSDMPQLDAAGATPAAASDDASEQQQQQQQRSPEKSPSPARGDNDAADGAGDAAAESAEQQPEESAAAAAAASE